MRRLLASFIAFCVSISVLHAEAPRAQTSYAPVTSGRALVFPADYGSHPEFRTEWWYVTGWLTTSDGQALGFQITFFRTKTNIGADNVSAFSPRQILIAHCAISDPKHGRLWQDQRIRRAGMGLAEAAVGDTAIAIDAWSLVRKDEHYVARLEAEDFSFDLTMTPTQAIMLNGEAGVSRKGLEPAAASYYYSLPHLGVSGSIVRQGTRSSVSGEAWLDHEWSSEYLDAQAVGWDWLGLNLSDGSAIMAFRIRGTRQDQHWAGGTIRSSNGTMRILAPEEIDFQPRRQWRSNRTSISYPVAWAVRVGDRVLAIEPLMDDQENDTRLTTGAIYWEGAVRARIDTQLIGQGYLELTGYGNPLKLP